MMGLFAMAWGVALNGFADIAETPQPTFIPACREPTCEWFVDAEFLYLQAKEDGLDYLRYSRIPNAESPGVTFKSHAAAPNFKWDGGFRFGAGYRNDEENYYSSLTWTYYRSKSKGHVEGPLRADKLYYISKRDTAQNNLPFDLVDSFTGGASWRLEYNTIDWEFGTPICLNQRFVLTPFMGLRGAFIEQRFRNHISTLNGDFDTTRSEKVKNSYYSGGVRAGFGLLVELCEGFTLFGNASGSLQYGRFDVKDKIDSNAARFIANSSTRRCRIRPNLESTVGLQWTTCLCESSYLTLQLGYEMIYWFDQNQIPGQIQPDLTHSSGLSLQGLQVAAIYDF